MDKKPLKSFIGTVVLLGAVWGLSEAALGMWLKSCASSVSGSIMTGFALLFLATSWVVSKRALGVVLLVLIASLFKLFDAWLLSLPIRHGAVANPIFAFILEGFIFLLFVSILSNNSLRKRSGQAFLGGLSCLGAVLLFPMVKLVTGIPACAAPGTAIPLSIYYAPLAAAISVLTVPLGFWIGERYDEIFQSDGTRLAFNSVLSPVVFIVCLAVVTVIRLI